MKNKIFVALLILLVFPVISVQARYDETVKNNAVCAELDADTELLARLINAEAGSDWCSDDLMYGVGSVVLNRVESDLFPNTIHDVIYQSGQYYCVKNGSINKKPCERARQIAINLMENGSMFPDDVLFQAEFVQGEVYEQIQNTYFCRKG